MPRRKHWILIGALGFLLTITIVWQVVKNFKIKRFIVENVHYELSPFVEDSLQLSIDGIYFKHLDKKLILEDVHINILSDSLESLASLQLGKIELDWDSYRDFLLTEVFEFNRLSFKGAAVSIPDNLPTLLTNYRKDSTQRKNFALLIHSIQLDSGKFNLLQNKEVRLEGKIQLSGENFNFNTQETGQDWNQLFDTLNFQLNDVKYRLPDGLHHITAQKISVNPLKQNISIRQFSYDPVPEMEKFFEIKGEEANYTRFYSDSIFIQTLQITADSLTAQHLGVHQAELTVFKDKAYPLPDDRVVPILVDELLTLPYGIDVRTVQVSALDIHYTEKGKIKRGTGTVELTDLSGKIENLTNLESSITKYGHYMNIHANGKMYGEGSMDAFIRYHLDSEHGYFELYANLEPMAMKPINNYVKPLFPVEIRSGQIDELKVKYAGSRYKVEGQMDFKYSDLKIHFNQIINEEEWTDNTLSALANVALSQKNPKPSGRYRIGKIEFLRDPRKSMFSYWTNSLLSGFQSTVGIKPPLKIVNLNAKDGKTIFQRFGFDKHSGNEE